MEKTSRLYCIKCSFDWSDLGTWQSLYELLEKDKNQNVLKGKISIHNSTNNLIISKNKSTAVVGLNNIAVINLEDLTLVIDLSKSEEVKHIIQSALSLKK